ncbi:uncharacterized protein LOC100212097 isoform X1 [Hydra vulgaris]|uniref:uncharacterized protein LOC100212097 isoform X1 n=1 Tax=Hydra vulgaris TaxID=6087 RepID=UPI001F5E4592|nr:uncharacterized protein LOC100212097 isoform X1 [Hydra vulgaris]
MILVNFVIICLYCVCAQPLNGKTAKKGYDEVEYDVTLLKSPITRKYYVKPEELPKYEEQFKKIRNLGEEIECKLTGICPGKKREKIIPKVASKTEHVKGKKKTFNPMFDDEQTDDLQQESQNQFMNDENMNSPEYDPSHRGNMFKNHSPNSRKTKSVQYGLQPSLDMERFRDQGSYTQQADAAQFGQQPQMDLIMPENMQEQNFAGQENVQEPNGINGFNGRNAGSMQGDGLLGNGFNGKNSGNMLEEGLPGNDEQGGRDSNEEITKFQNQRMEDAIHQSVADRMNYLLPSSKGQQITAMSRGLEDDPYGDLGDGMGKVFHSYPNQIDLSQDSSVTEDDIIKIEAVQPGEIDNLHRFLKKSQNRFMGGDKNQDNVLNGKNTDQLGLDRFGDSSYVNSRPPSPDFVEENAKLAMQTNSDYEVPSSAFSTLWKSFLLTTQSQLGENDPSANSREGINKPHSKQKSRSPQEKAKKDPEVRHSKKSNVGKRSLDKNLTKRTTVPNQKFMYIPLYVVKNLLVHAKVASRPESDVNNRLEKKTNTKLTDGMPFYIETKQGKRYLVINPNSQLVKNSNKFLINLAGTKKNILSTTNNKNNFQNNFINPINMVSNQLSSLNSNLLPFKHAFNYPFYSSSTQNELFQSQPELQHQIQLKSPLNSNVGFLTEQTEMQGMSKQPNSIADQRPLVINGFNVLQGEINQEGLYKGYVAIPFSAQLSKEQNAFTDFRFEKSPSLDYSHELSEGLNSFDTFEKITAKQPTVPGYYYKDPVYDPLTSETIFQDESNLPDPRIFNVIKPKAEKQELIKSLRFAKIINQYNAQPSADKGDSTLGYFLNQQRIHNSGNKNKYQNENIKNSPYLYKKEHIGYQPLSFESNSEKVPLNEAINDDNKK